jgi:hypothetical protein
MAMWQPLPVKASFKTFMNVRHWQLEKSGAPLRFGKSRFLAPASAPAVIDLEKNP